MPSPRQSAAPPPFAQSRDYVQSLARGLTVLAAFDAEHPTLSLAGIATRTGLSRAAARRLVLTLQHLGYVRALGREFSLSPRVLELGFGCLSSLKLTDLAQPLVEQLAPNGRLIAPVGSRYGIQLLQLLRKDAQGRAVTRSVLEVRFVPLTRAR